MCLKLSRELFYDVLLCVKLVNPTQNIADGWEKRTSSLPVQQSRVLSRSPKQQVDEWTVMASNYQNFSVKLNKFYGHNWRQQVAAANALGS